MKTGSGSCAVHTVISASPPSTPHVARSGTRICRRGASPALDARAAGAHGCALAGSFPRATCLRGRLRPHGGAPPAPPHLAHRHLLPSFHRLLDKPRAPPRRRRRSAPSLGFGFAGAGGERAHWAREARRALSRCARGAWGIGLWARRPGWPLSLARLVLGNFISESRHSLQTERGGGGAALAEVTRRSRG